jgi:hypothetical protein
MFKRATIRDIVGDALVIESKQNGDLLRVTAYDSLHETDARTEFTSAQVRRIRDALTRFLGE